MSWQDILKIIATAIAVFLFWLGALFLDSNIRISYLLFKIAIAILYLIFIAIFLNFTVFNLFNFSNKKYQLLRILFCVAIPLVILITIPFYVQWCGLDGENFKTFLNVYSAVCGGGLTLIGVAWTIKRQDEKYKLNKMEEARPFLGIINDFYTRLNEAENNFIQFCRKEFEGVLYKKLTCRLMNSDKAIFYIEKLVVDEVDCISELSN